MPEMEWEDGCHQIILLVSQLIILNLIITLLHNFILIFLSPQIADIPKSCHPPITPTHSSAPPNPRGQTHSSTTTTNMPANRLHPGQVVSNRCLVTWDRKLKTKSPAPAAVIPWHLHSPRIRKVRLTQHQPLVVQLMAIHDSR